MPRQKTRIQTAHEAMALLKAERKRRGLSLADVAEHSGIDKSRLSKLEADPCANPTFSTVLRIAEALGVRLTIALSDAA